MSVSVDPDHFFQTSESIAERERRKKKSSNNHGRPTHLPGKITAVICDPTDPESVLVTESTGTARKVRVKAHKNGPTYQGATAPLTSIATKVASSVSPTTATVFAGCWDKTIWSWEISSARLLRRFSGGHTDFVKCITTLRRSAVDQPTQNLLISSGADGTIVIWDSDSGSRLSVIKGGHSRGILYLAVDPDPPPGTNEAREGMIFSAGSDREIRRWTISPPHPCKEIHADAPIIRHETSVNQLLFDADSDLWTASADGTTKNLVRERDWASDMEINHGSSVRCVTVDERGGHIVTAGRDEDIKIWDRATGTLRHTFVGHFDEITGMIILGGQLLVSVSLDGTIRSWSLQPSDIETARREVTRGHAEEDDLAKKPSDRSLITEDEERELEALMEDGD